MPLLPPLVALSGWWQDLARSQQVFYGIALLAACAILVMALMSMIGFGDMDADALDVGDGSSLFSIKPITGFFFGFGWTGGAAIEQGCSLTLAMVLAGVAGVIVMGSVVAVLKASLRLRSSGNLRKELAIGKVATVYLTIPSARAGAGQVTVPLDGRTITIGAIQGGEQPIPTHAKVRVTELVDGDTVRVEPLT